MDRRRVLLAASALVSAPLLRAQGVRPKYLIGWLSPVSAESDKALMKAFKARLLELGYMEGREFALDARFCEGKPERFSALARELVASRPAVIVTASSAGVAAMQRATTTIPVVFGTAADPVEQGFVKSLARPGGNITGVTVRAEMSAKVQGLVRETLPVARRVALLQHEDDVYAKRSAQKYLEAAAKSGHEMSVVWVKDARDFGRAFAEIRAFKADAMIVPQLSLFAARLEELAERAAKARLPLFAQIVTTAGPGILMTYGSDNRENYRRAAVLVDKILKGARPGDLAIEQPDVFLLTVNLRTARALGVQIPQSILLRADQVIE